MKRVSFIITTLISILLFCSLGTYAHASDSLPFIVLSDYSETMQIGDSFYLIAFTSNGKTPSFKSSNSKVASVNTYGMITAKKGGTATITAKIKNAEASCKVTVDKTIINLNKRSATIERNSSFMLNATTSNNSEVSYKSSKKSVATIDENGCVLGIKPGETIITASADGSSKTCRITVKEPTITLNKTRVSLYRGQTFLLSASVSSGVAPTYKSNRSKVALVDNSGMITALKHGTAIITAKVDGTTKICEINVMPPTIKLSQEELTLTVGETFQLKAEVSSGNIPTYTSSKSSVILVDANGNIEALKKGTAYVTVAEDGTKVKCKIIVES